MHILVTTLWPLNCNYENSHFFRFQKKKQRNNTLYQTACFSDDDNNINLIKRKPP